MAGGVHYFTMHRNGCSIAAPGGVKCIAAGGAGGPSKFDQSVIIVGVNEGELSAGNRDPAGVRKTEFVIFARIEIGAARVEVETAVGADIASSLVAYQNRPANTDYPDGEMAVVATLYSFNFSHRDHREKTLATDFTDFTDLSRQGAKTLRKDKQ